MNFDNSVFEKVVVIDIIIFIMIMFLSPLIASIFDGNIKVQPKSIIKSIISDVILLTALIAILLNVLKVPIPEIIMNTSDYIGGTFSLLVTVFLAISLKKPDLKRLKLLAISTFGRLVLAGLIVFIVIVMASPSNVMTKALILALAAPFSSYPLLYTDKHKLDSELVAQLSLFSRIVAFILYPILIGILLGYN